MIALIFWWSPSSSSTMNILSIPVWTLFIIHVASIAGDFRVPIFLAVIVLSVVGIITEVTKTDEQDQGR